MKNGRRTFGDRGCDRRGIVAGRRAKHSFRRRETVRIGGRGRRAYATTAGRGPSDLHAGHGCASMIGDANDEQIGQRGADRAHLILAGDHRERFRASARQRKVAAAAGSARRDDAENHDYCATRCVRKINHP